MRAFQRTILAATLLGTAFGATCADVKMYGTYDAGLVYQNFRHSDRSDLTMANGQTGMDNSLFGLQGREELGNGLYAGFQLEGGFNPDDGTMNTSNTLFDRKARLFIGNETFEMTAGRFGNFTQAMTPYSVYGKLRANMSLTSMPGFAPANITWNGTFLSNAVAVRTNAKTGFFAQALYSNGDTGEEQYGWSDRRKVGQLAAGWTGEQLRFGSVLTYETQTRYSAEGKPSHAKRDATVGLHLIASYDFGGPAVSAVLYHGENDWRIGPAADLGNANMLGEQWVAAYNRSTEGFTTNALFLSGVYPMGAHSVAATLGAMKGEWQGDMTGLETDEADVLMGGVIYRYRLSKRTTLYTAASYTKAGDLLSKLQRLNQTFVTMGVSHSF